jgi:hypothetical protein
VVVPQFQTRSGSGGKVFEVFLDALADGLESFEPGGPFDDMDAHAFGRAVIDGGKDGHVTLHFRKGGSGIRAPHLIWSGGHDRPLVRVTGSWFWLPGGGQ